MTDNTCGAVTVLNQNISSTTAYLNWNNVGSPNYKVKIKPAGGTWTTATITASEYTFTGLTPATHYNYKITNKCPGTGGFTRSGSFTTLPARLSASDILNSVTVSPNPSKGIFYINGITDETNVQVFDMMGKEIMQLNMSAKGNIDCSACDNGMYIIRLSANGAVSTTIPVIITK